MATYTVTSNKPTGGMKDYRSASYKARAASVASGGFTPSEIRSLQDKGYSPKYLKSLSRDEIRDLASREGLSTSSIPESKVGVDAGNVVSSPTSGQVAVRGDVGSNVVYSSRVSSASVGSPLTSPNQTQNLQSDSTNRSDINPVVRAMFRGEVSPIDVIGGRVRVVSVPVSGALASKINTGKPMSVREDVQYTATGISTKRNKPSNINKTEDNKNDSANTKTGSNNNSSDVLRLPLGNNKTIPREETGFEKRVRESVKRQTDFFNSEGFKRIDALANWMTIGKGKPIEQRSFAGQTSEMVVGGLMKSPLQAGASIIASGENIGAFSEGLFKNRKETTKEFFVNAPKKLEKGAFSFLPGGTPINPEGASTVITAAIFAGVSYPSFKNNPATRTILTKTYPDKFIPIEKTNIKFVESYTEPTTRKQLIKLEGKKAETIHVTTGDLFKRSVNERMFDSQNFLETFKGQKESIITSAKPAMQGAGPFRNKNLLLNFYKSSPDPVTGQPRAYLGYAGILKAGEKASSSRVIIGKPDIKLIRFIDEISITPESVKKQDLLGINKYQATTGSGKTFVPAENLKSMSVEGQLITPSSYKGVPRAKEFGLTKTSGSKIIRIGESQFTYYKQVKSNNNILTKVSNLLDEVTGRNYYKMELIDAKTGKVKSSKLIPKTEKTLDIVKYNESYGKTSYVSSQPVIPFGVYSSSSRSRNKSSGSRNNSNSNFSSNLTSSSTGASIGSSNISSSNNSSPQKSIISGLKSSSLTSSSSKITSSGSSIISSNKPSSGYNSTSYITLTPNNRDSSIILYPKPKNKKDVGLFNVEVRRRGEFVNVGKGLGLEKAIKLGKDITTGTAARTFRITSGKNIVNINAPTGFYKKNGSLIENKKLAINTKGELNEITFKGIQTNKNLNKKSFRGKLL